MYTYIFYICYNFEKKIYRADYLRLLRGCQKIKYPIISLWFSVHDAFFRVIKIVTQRKMEKPQSSTEKFVVNPLVSLSPKKKEPFFYKCCIFVENRKRAASDDLPDKHCYIDR